MDLSNSQHLTNLTFSLSTRRAKDGKVYDSFTISRDYKDVLACDHDGCEPTTLANQTQICLEVYVLI